MNTHITTDNEAAAVEAAIGRLPADLTHSQAWPQEYVNGWNDAMATVREELPEAIAAHTAASSGEVVAYTKDNGPGKVVGLEWNPYYSVHELRGRVPLYTTLPAAVPADALERLVSAQASIRGLIAEIDPARKPATGELKLIADQLRDTLAAMIPKGAE